MEDPVPIKSRHLKVANPQKRRMIAPDVMLHTRNVMIPVVRPVPFEQSFNILFSKNRPEILRAQNYRNNPALLFSETPLHTLYDPLENSLEVKRISRWKLKNQNTRYAISGKIDSPSVKKTSISQNSYPSKRLSRKKKNNALHFPNTALAQSEPSTDDKDLHKASSRSIKLTRKCDLSRMKEGQIKREDIFAVLPKIEAPISSVMSKPVASLPSQSFYDIVDTISVVSTLSVSSFKLEKKRTFANIVNREKLVSGTASNYLYPSNSEYEINVLHYENDILSGNNFPHLTQSHVKSTNTKWSDANNCSSVKIQDDTGNLADETRNAIESRHRWDEGETARDIKYSWEIDDWRSSQRKGRDNAREVKIVERNAGSPYDCKIKYSWQVIGTGTQTSYSLLQDLLNSTSTEDDEKSAYKMCSIKYSWQIIGIGTQASLHGYNDPDYWSGMLLTPSKNYNEYEAQIGNDETDHSELRDHARYPEGRSKKYLILNNQQTQTFAEKEVQADASDCYAKYSWHNLIKQYLYGTNFRSTDQTKAVR